MSISSAASDPAFLAAARNPTGGDPQVNAQFVHQLQSATQSGQTSGAGETALQDSSFIQQLDPTLAHPFLVGFSEAMSVVFLVASGVMVFAFIATLFLPHVDLGPDPRKAAAVADDEVPATPAGH